MTECTLQIKKFPATLHHTLRIKAAQANILLRDLVIRILEESTRKEGRAK